jgi:hypothetical protein
LRRVAKTAAGLAVGGKMVRGEGRDEEEMG